MGWLNAGYEDSQIEPLRQQLLRQKDVGQVVKAMRKLGIHVKRQIVQAVKRYNFDSAGIAFFYANFVAWRRLATGQGRIRDAAYLIHEIAEVEELQRIQKETGFRFMGPKNLEKLSRTKRQQWESDFELYYLSSHSKALEAEYEFIVEQVFRVTNGTIKITKLQAAAIDTTRNKEAWQYLLVDGIPMQLHHHFDAWRKRNDEIIQISESVQKKLRYYRSTIMLDNLIIYLKNMPIE